MDISQKSPSCTPMDTCIDSASALLTCLTCKINSVERSHYKSLYHRYNLQRKLVGKPPVSEDDFKKKEDAVNVKKNEAAAAEKVKNEPILITADDDDDDEWESMSEDSDSESVEVQKNEQRGRRMRGAKWQDLTDFEMVLPSGSRSIGNRHLRVYYKQKHRAKKETDPSDHKSTRSNCQQLVGYPSGHNSGEMVKEHQDLEKRRLKLALRSNKLQRYFRKQTN